MVSKKIYLLFLMNIFLNGTIEPFLKMHKLFIFHSFMVVERELQLAGFWESIPARNKLKAEIQKILLSPEFNNLPNIRTNRNQIISRVMELAEKNSDRILYAD
jgi:hypothetical protein